MKSQLEQVKEILRTRGSITPLEALNACGCFRLSGVIYKLRRQGMEIKTEDEVNAKGNIYARYTYCVPEEEIQRLAKELMNDCLLKYENDEGEFIIRDQRKRTLYVAESKPDFVEWKDCFPIAGMSMKELQDLALETVRSKYSRQNKN